MSNLYYKPGRNGSISAPAKLSVVTWAHNSHVRIQVPAYRVDFSIYGQTEDLIQELHRLASLATPSNGKSDAEPGIIRGEAEPIPTPQSYSFNLINLADIAQAPTIAVKLRLLIERFKETLPDVAEALIQDYKALTGTAWKPAASAITSDAPDQLALDLAAVQSIAGELIGDDGAPVWGAQSRIAAALGITTGGSHRARVLAVVEALLASSAGSGDADGGERRAA